jgi:hypothetical protein
MAVSQYQFDRKWGADDSIDIGHNRWAFQTQMNAIQNMNYDPVQQDMADVQHFKDYPSMSQPIQDESSLGSASNSIWPRKQPLPEQTILAGTALRDKVLRAFQEDYIPYEPKWRYCCSSQGAARVGCGRCACSESENTFGSGEWGLGQERVDQKLVYAV